MSTLEDTQPHSPFDTQPVAINAATQGPGCMAWGLLTVAATAFSLLIVIVAGLSGYFVGQNEADTIAAGEVQATLDHALTEAIPTRVAEGNVAFIEGYLDWFAEITPPPAALPDLIATGTQLALDIQPTITPTPLPSATPTLTVAAPTDAPTATPFQQPTDDPNAPIFDASALFAEAQAQFQAGDYDAAAETLEAVMGVDPTFRPDEVNALILEALTTQASQLLRSGDPENLSVGIIKANEAEQYGDIGELNFERYIAGLYLNAQSLENEDPQGAITAYAEVYGLAPNFLDVRTRIYELRIDQGDLLFEQELYCEAVAEYQAAVGLFGAPPADGQIKLQNAQAGCGGAPVTGVTPGVEGETPLEAPTIAPVGEVAPVGEQ